MDWFYRTTKPVAFPVDPLAEIRRRKSLNQSLASKSMGSTFVDEVEDYTELPDLVDFYGITFDTNQISEKTETTTFTEDASNSSNESSGNYPESATENNDNKEIGLSEGSDSCTNKTDYPATDSSFDSNELKLQVDSNPRTYSKPRINSKLQTNMKPKTNRKPRSKQRIDRTLLVDDKKIKRFACRHCGKMYGWKSTLSRHENEECGGKGPSHKCPYCEYKAKQRGNLGVHVRKHHPGMPELESLRKKQ